MAFPVKGKLEKFRSRRAAKPAVLKKTQLNKGFKCPVLKYRYFFCTGMFQIKYLYFKTGHLNPLFNCVFFNTAGFAALLLLNFSSFPLTGNAMFHWGRFAFEMCIRDRLLQTVQFIKKKYEHADQQRQQGYIDEVERLIEKNYQNCDYGVLQIATDLNLSNTYISKLYKDLTGTNIIERLTQYRMKAAVSPVSYTHLGPF